MAFKIFSMGIIDDQIPRDYDKRTTRYLGGRGIRSNIFSDEAKKPRLTGSKW